MRLYDTLMGRRAVIDIIVLAYINSVTTQRIQAK